MDDEIQFFPEGKITNKARRKARINPVYGLELDISVMNSKVHKHTHTHPFSDTHMSLTHTDGYIYMYIFSYIHVSASTHTCISQLFSLKWFRSNETLVKSENLHT